jgi:hypothetical protein
MYTYWIHVTTEFCNLSIWILMIKSYISVQFRLIMLKCFIFSAHTCPYLVHNYFNYCFYTLYTCFRSYSGIQRWLLIVNPTKTNHPKWIIIKNAQIYHIFDSYTPTNAHMLYRIKSCLSVLYTLFNMKVFLILLWNSMMITDRKMNGNYL